MIEKHNLLKKNDATAGYYLEELNRITRRHEEWWEAATEAQIWDIQRIPRRQKSLPPQLLVVLQGFPSEPGALRHQWVPILAERSPLSLGDLHRLWPSPSSLGILIAWASPLSLGALRRHWWVHRLGLSALVGDSLPSLSTPRPNWWFLVTSVTYPLPLWIPCRPLGLPLAVGSSPSHFGLSVDIGESLSSPGALDPSW